MPDEKGTTGVDAYSTSTDAPTGMAEDLESDNPYRFSWKRLHGGTGAYDIRFRDYNPGINRFLTRGFYQGALKDLASWTAAAHAAHGHLDRPEVGQHKVHDGRDDSSRLRFMAVSEIIAWADRLQQDGKITAS